MGTNPTKYEVRTKADEAEAEYAPTMPAPKLRPSAEQSREEGVTLLELLTIFVRHWRLIVGLPLAVALLLFGMATCVAPTYTASTSFTPEERSDLSKLGGLAGFAGQLGISIGGASGESPRFYAELVESRELLEGALRFKYPLSTSHGGRPDSVVLLDFLQPRVRETTPARRLEKGVRRLRALVAADVNNQTNVVTVSVDAKDPVLAAAVANRLMSDLNAFNLRRRQSSAHARREFIEQRLAGAGQELRAAENELTEWLRANRSYQTSPQLQAEYQRLQRRLDVRQETYLTLSRQYEAARIEEVNSTPLITVIDTATPPQWRSKPRRSLWALAGIFVGGLAGVMVTFTREFFHRARRENPEEFEELDQALAMGRRKRRREREQRVDVE